MSNQAIMIVNTTEYIRASKAQNTQRAYQAALREFEVFCREHRVPYLPAEQQVVIAYLEWLAQRNRPSTIQVKLSALSLAHRMKGLPDPTQSELVKTVVAGIRRKLGTAPSRKAPITFAELSRMVRASPKTLRGKRDKALLLLGFAGAFRRSELAGLDVADLRFGSHKMTVTLRHSKTDQEGQGMKKVIPRLQDESLCPVRAVKDWLDAARITSGPVFRPVDKWHVIHSRRLTDRAMATIIKDAAKQAGLDERQFSGHSLRAGFVTEAAMNGTSEWKIQEVTGHKSPAVLRGYIRDMGVGQVDAIRRAFGESVD
jgi:site-specific recombinase XerD